MLRSADPYPTPLLKLFSLMITIANNIVNYFFRVPSEHTSKKLTNISSDTNTLFLPEWAEVPAADEIAVEGKSKDLYCLAYGK